MLNSWGGEGLVRGRGYLGLSLSSEFSIGCVFNVIFLKYGELLPEIEKSRVIGSH